MDNEQSGLNVKQQHCLSQNVEAIDKEDLAIHFLKEHDLRYVDNRDKGGVLWVRGGIELAELFSLPEAVDFDFRFAVNGGNATNHQPAWWTGNRDKPLIEPNNHIQDAIQLASAPSYLNAPASDEKLRNCSRLEAKCSIFLLLKTPYDLKRSLLESGLIYMGHLANMDRTRLFEQTPTSYSRIDLLISKIRGQGIKFPIVCPSLNQDEPDDFYSTYIDSAFFPAELNSLSLDNPDLHITPGFRAKLHQIGIDRIDDLIGVSDSALLAQKGIGDIALEKFKVGVAKFAVHNGIGDPLQAGRGYDIMSVQPMPNNNSSAARKTGDRIMPLVDGAILNDLQLTTSLEELDFTLATKRAFASLGYTTIDDLVDKPLSPFLQQSGIGQRSVSKMQQVLADFGIPIVGFASGVTHEDILEENYRVPDDLAELVGEQYAPASQLLEIKFDSVQGFQVSAPITKPVSLAKWLSPTGEAIFAGDKPHGINGSTNIAEFAQRDLDLNNSLTDALLAADNKGQIQKRLIEKCEETSSLIPEYLSSLSFSLVCGLALPRFKPSMALTIEGALEKSKRSIGLSYALGLLGAILRVSHLLATQAQSSQQLASQLIVDAYPRATAQHIDIYKQRHGVGCSKRTLQEIADEVDLTRERIRQITKRIEDRFCLSSSLRFLIPRILVVDAVIKGDQELKGLATLVDSTPFMDSPSLVASLTDELISENNRFFLASKYDSCTKCEPLNRFLGDLDATNGLTAYDKMKDACHCDSCGSLSDPTKATVKSLGKIEIIEGYVGATNNPVIKSLKKPDNDRAAVASILYQSSEPLNYDMLVVLFREKTGRNLTKARAISYLGSLEDSLFWGRGTYLHRRFAPEPNKLIDRVKNQVMNLFSKNKVPILGVGGLFDIFKDELIESGIPGEQALYSLIRLQDYPELRLQEYPWVCLEGAIGDRTSFAKYFYSVLADNNGFITDAHAEAIAERTMAQSFALGGLAEYSPLLINANGGWYDIEAAGFDMEGIAQLATEVADKMKDDDIVSTVKVFDDYKARCYALGVKSYDILYYLIDMLEDDLPIEATRRPHLVKSQHKGLSVRAIARKFIRESDKPVTRLELIDEFSVHRGINASGLSSPILLGEDIVLVGSDTYWSKEALGLNGSYMDYFNEAIASKIGLSRKIANLFYPVASLASNLDGVNPPHGVRWNKELIHTVFSESNNYRLFGETSGCVVDINANPTTTSAESFYVDLLDNEFMGWSPFDAFAKWCANYGIRRDLEPEFFDAFDSIEADEFSIQAV